jgi:mRNA-degrading endonuclease RelE of RelBE toxin-antitoxin system
MNLVFTERARKSYENAPAAVQKAFDKQTKLLAENPHHPSLRAKKYGGAEGVWQARVNKDWRFYFTVERDIYTIIGLTPHPK